MTYDASRESPDWIPGLTLFLISKSPPSLTFILLVFGLGSGFLIIVPCQHCHVHKVVGDLRLGEVGMPWSLLQFPNLIHQLDDASLLGYVLLDLPLDPDFKLLNPIQQLLYPLLILHLSFICNFIQLWQQLQNLFFILFELGDYL